MVMWRRRPLPSSPKPTTQPRKCLMPCWRNMLIGRSTSVLGKFRTMGLRHSVERHHKDVLSRHRQKPWYLPGVILRKTGQDVYVIEVGNNKMVEPDHTLLLPQEPDPHGPVVPFEFTTDAFDSNADGEEDEYTAERILSHSPIPAHQGGGYTRSNGRALLHGGTGGKLWAALCHGIRPYCWTTSRPRTSSWMSRMCWYTSSRATEIEAITLNAF